MKILGDQQVQGIVKVSRRVVEGLKAQLVSGDFRLSKRSEKFFRFVATESANVFLPDATTLTSGFEFVLYTSSDNIHLLDGSGSEIQELVPGIVYYCYLMGNATVSGEWVVSSDTSYDITLGDEDDPSRGVRSYFKIYKEYTGVL